MRLSKSHYRILLLTAVMAAIAGCTAVATIATLYGTAFEEQRAKLAEGAQRQACLIRAIAHFDAKHGGGDHPGGARGATLSRIAEAFENVEESEGTTQFGIAEQKGGKIVFLLMHGERFPDPVPVDGALAEPMRRALSGESGTLIGPDWRGRTVLAAYEPVPELGLGIVAKMDLAEIRAPFIRAGFLTGGITLAFVLVGCLLFLRAGSPLVRHIEEQERLYRTLFEDSNDAEFLMVEGRFEACNKRACDLLGRGREEIVGRSPTDFSPETQRNGRTSAELTGEQTQAALSGVPQSFDWTLLRKDGTEVHTEVLVKSVEIAGRKVLLGSVRDVTRRKRTQEALRASESKYRTLLENLPQRVFFKDRDSVYIACNEKYAADLGIPPEEIRGKQDGDFYPPELSEKYRADDRRIMESGSTEEIEEPYERAGERRWVHTVKTPVRDDDGQIVGVLGVFWDITDQKRAAEEKSRLEERLHQVQRMEAVGRLTGGVAHDFNNLLMVINGYAQLLSEGLPEEDPARKDLEEICSAGQRAGDLTRQLLAFSRQQVLEPKVVDINQVVSGLQKMIRRLVSEDIEVEVILGENLPRTKVDPGQLGQVVLNLTANACDVMSEGGTLRIETGRERVRGNGDGMPPDVAAGSYVTLAVSDTGPGLDEESRSKIFEPFFAPKGGEGDKGLGLSAAYGIVKQSGGHIDVDSRPGRGSTFRIYLPELEESAAAPRETESPEASLDASETILLVEDEESLRRMAAIVLGKCGYTVLQASNGEEALDLASRHEGEIDLLLTDVVMPRMGGRDLAERLRRIRPEIKVLFMSGYTKNGGPQEGDLSERSGFLQKPVTPKEIRGKVREILGIHRV